MSPTIQAYDFVHLALKALGCEVRGKTKLQKTVFFLGVLTRNVDALGYRAHYYGPYSDAVADAMNRLKSLGYVDQSTAGTGGLNGFGFEVCRYDYSLNEQGAATADAKKDKFPEVWPRLQKAATRLKQAGEIDYMKLSIAAKIYYIMTQNGEKVTYGGLMASAKNLGWNVLREDVDNAIEYLGKLKLVQSS